MNMLHPVKYLLVLLLIWFRTGIAQVEPVSLNSGKLKNAFEQYLDVVHPQKIYLQLDKDEYQAPERIWFRAFLLDAKTNEYDGLSQHVYVELIDPYQRVVQVIRVKTGMNDGAGDFVLSDTVPEGIYQIRAYTNWMKNFGQEYFFTRNIKVRNIMHKYLITEKEARKNLREVHSMHKKMESGTMGFFPEGGNLLTGIENTVAFKAMDIFGNSVDAEGKVMDRDKNVVCTFYTEHAGMGSFSFVPEPDKDYTALVLFENGEIIKYKLPVAVTNSVGLSLGENEEEYVLRIKSNKLLSSDRPANEFVLIGQASGRICHQSVSNLIDSDTLIVIQKKTLPTGIIHFTLLTNRQIPVSERLAFNNRRDFLNFDIQGSSGMDSLYIILNLPGSASANTYFDGAVSVILSDSVPAGNPAINILTELYLTSDLPGNIEHPAYYLSQATPEIRRNTDLLMLTHGWTRYTWRDIVNNEVPKIKYPPEEGITIEGKITREILEFPLKNADVKLYIQDEYNDEFQTYSGENGRFRFDNLNYSDTIDVKIVARREGGGKNLLIHIEEITPDKVTDLQHDNYLTTESKINMRAYRKIQNKLAQEQMQLREKELDSIFSRSIHGRPDNVLWGDELPSGYSNLQEAMRGRIPGVNITGDRIIIRGVGTLMGSTDPLVIVDDVPTDVSVLRSIPVEDVDRVEILKGPSTAMYGSRGGNGVIAVYTKRGSYMKKGEIEFSMLGYHITEKFYSPGTSTIQQKADNKMLPVTLYWNPEIEVGSKEVQIAIPNERNSLNKIIIIEGTDGQGNIGYGYAVLR